MTAEQFILVDGREADAVPAMDRGLMYGDGVFRTIRVESGKPIWWPEHMAKLAADAMRLGIACPSPDVWQRDMEIAAACCPNAALKLVLTRGVGHRGYALPKEAAPTRVVVAGPLPTWPAELWETGVNVRLCDLRLSRQPRLAGIKHLNRLENVLARAEWSDPDIHEGILLDETGHVIGGVSSNIFIHRAGELLTPRLDLSGVAGVARARLMAQAANNGVSVRECELSLSDLLDADEVLLSNSLIGIWHVARLGQRVWPAPVLGPVVRKFLYV